MEFMHLSSSLILLAYASATGLLLLNRPVESRIYLFASRAGLGCFFIGTLLTTIALLSHFGRSPSHINFAGLLLICILSILTLIGYLQFKLQQIIKFTAPLVTLITMLAIFTKSNADSLPATGVMQSSGPLLVTHIFFSSLGQAFAIIACIISLMYLWQQRILKKKIIEQLRSQSPSLGRIDFHLNLSLWVGFIFISLALVTGAILTLSVDSHSISMQGKILWAILVWVWYLAILLSRNIYKMPAKRMAQMSLGGFFLLALTFFGLSFASGFVFSGGVF